jgi:hypothetical protein
MRRVSGELAQEPTADRPQDGLGDVAESTPRVGRIDRMAEHADGDLQFVIVGPPHGELERLVQIRGFAQHLRTVSIEHSPVRQLVEKPG